MSLNSIRNILNSRMATLSGSPRIAWENVNFVPKTTESHYRVNFLPSQTRPAANHRSAMDFENGIYQIDIYAVQNEGTSTSGAMAETVRDHFYRGLKLTDSSGVSVHIAATPSVIMTSREAGFWRTQIDVRWFSYVPGSAP